MSIINPFTYKEDCRRAGIMCSYGYMPEEYRYEGNHYGECERCGCNHFDYIELGACLMKPECQPSWWKKYVDSRKQTFEWCDKVTKDFVENGQLMILGAKTWNGQK